MDDPELMRVFSDWATVFMRLSMHDFNRCARSAGLSLTQMNALTHLYHKGPQEVMDFVGLMQVSPAGASQMVDRMVQQGWVRRAELPGDRRVRQVHLTDRGRQIVEESIAARRLWVEALTASLSAEEKEPVRKALAILTQRAIELEAQLAGLE